MMANFKMTVSEDTYITVAPGGMVEIFNELEVGQIGVGLRYAEVPAAINALRDALSHIYDAVCADCVAVQFLCLTHGEMATKDMVEDVVMLRWGVERGMVHEVLNRITENGQTAYRRADEDDAGWVWRAQTSEPRPSDYPEFLCVLQRAVRAELKRTGKFALDMAIKTV